MPILTGDIKLVASQVMDDVPEGGGAPTAKVIADGVSNAIFPDISELDRAGGRVNLRKLHVSVQTDDTDTYMGSNVIVAEPPADPRVSVTLFTTNSTFDRRTQAASRVESYLNKGPLWPGILYENHIAGQRSVQVLQEVKTELPAIGQTLVLVQYEGASNEVQQYIRTTAVESVIRTFYDPSSNGFEKAVVTLSISDALRTDFIGSPASKQLNLATNAAKMRDTVVADAGVYVGVSPLASAASLGSFTVNATSVFTQLVPSAQTETPISDVRTNGLSAALVPTGGAVTQTISMGFTTSTNMFVGGPIYPGSLNITRSGVTATDAGGLLISAAQEVGQVDYDNGIVKLSTNVWGAGAGSHQVTFTPAAVPDLISDQRAIRVTAESRALNYAFVMDDVPLKRTLSLSYLAQGRWYVLRDNGAGVLSGVNSAYGMGTINYTTGAVSVTLGALPDVGSSVVVQSYSKATTVASNTLLLNGGRVFVPINSDGLISEDKGSKTIGVGHLTVTWSHLGATKHAYDNALGGFTGDASGSIDYAQGVVRLSPNELPEPGTTFSLMVDALGDGYSTAAVQLHNANPPTYTIPGSPGYTIPGATAHLMVQPGTTTVTYPTPGTFSLTRVATIYYFPPELAGRSGNVSNYTPAFDNRPVTVTITDNGQGELSCLVEGVKIVVGAVDYASAQFTLGQDFALAQADPKGPVFMSHSGYVKTWTELTAGDATSTRTMMLWEGTGLHHIPPSYSYTPPVYEDVAVAAVDVPPVNPVVHTEAQTPPPPTTTLTSALVSQYLVRTLMVPNYTLKGVGFALGTTRYQQLTDGTLLKDVVPTTGGGTPAGSVSAALCAVYLSTWPTGASPVLTDWRALIAPPAVGVEAPFTAFSSTFRTASSPLRPASVSVLGTMQDGTAFNVTADADGKINGTRVKGRVDYQYGLVELYFVNPAGDVSGNVDLSFLGIAGLDTIPADLVMLSSVRYNAVAYSYLPLDAALLGIDPVRLPSDGRVPIFRSGGFAVVGHTGSITATVSNAQTIDCARVRLSRVRVVGQDGVVINTGYSADLEAGTVTFIAVAGYSQPVTVEHRIEDMAVVREAQISGEVTFTRAITHDYPLGSYVSSALVAGDLKSRVSVLFDQATWNGTTWLDAVSGTAATGTFNDVLAPIVVTNKGAVSERWALVFTNTTSFQIVGEHVGVIGTGNINSDTSPGNPATGTPYFTVPALGWGIGWSAGNMVRLNTVGAMTPVWVVRTIQQGPNTGTEHSFTLLSRGDVDRP